MRNEYVQINMKVVPHKKSKFNPLHQSREWINAKENGQPYLFVDRWLESEKCWVLKSDEKADSGDFFLASDFEPYQENKMNDVPEPKYMVVMVRKSDGKTFLPDSTKQKNGIDTLDEAMYLAKYRAQNHSDDYRYVVFLCTPVVAYELDSPPTKETFFSK